MIASIIKGLRPITRPQLLYGVYTVPLVACGKSIGGKQPLWCHFSFRHSYI